MTEYKKDLDIYTNARKLGVYGEIAKKHESSGRCIFCNLKDKYVIHRQDNWALTVNLFPRSTGDLLVVPERHVETFSELNESDYLAMSRLNKLGMDLLSRALNINSFYLLLRDGSQTDKTIRHLHSHIQHYWKGLVEWHPEDSITTPIEVAGKLKKTLDE